MARSRAETHAMVEYAPCGDIHRGGKQMMRGARFVFIWMLRRAVEILRSLYNRR